MNTELEVGYRTRWVPARLTTELINLYHLARVPLSGEPDGHTRWKRMQWAAKAFVKAHPEFHPTAVYKDLVTYVRR